ncbi:uncharacterized protein LOC122319425 isoform X1 [Carya illinoinensis]|uniref:J domain-containing protein n=1 Tax=Carya illinoinensis TaxID=32201 RepID=A0A8T1RNC4_CARIL|nr:uncharacterized protein LOC122319425 isoform X1 [Carya illinoinensis]XP_042993425.1 uncharacterized protein LOC122319425 isoform X1 [Carya illinoinensis]KAG6668209.1 hypothetical protein CIPAW_01G154700 [Carya illinoinensis]KAG6731948.1 hypothetical protein I3842_01G153200 [Carya illinoinensis]KAG6731951.1 hypothetical protein I3842_01G153200 [Carya illinoinensis]
MDCNKEEAIRAKGIAEKKMESKDFEGARRVALKAQQLYSDLENISQMVTVCDVHCAADKKLFGNETDWYAILQIEQTANDAMIKKQYRKFALQLHPDKNKFSGAEAAFKLIGEAQRVLLDREKRSLYDMRRRASGSKPAAPHRPPQKASWNSNVRVQNDFRGKFTALNPQQQQQQQQPQPAQAGLSDVRPTFWTACPFCSVRYQYYREVVNRSLRCHTCNKPFIAYDVNVHVASPTINTSHAPPTTNMSQPAVAQEKYGASKVEVGCKGNLRTQNSKPEPFQKKSPTSKFGSEKVSGKRGRKQVVESSESCDSDSSTDSEDVEVGNDDNLENVCNGDLNPRRSTRNKQQVTYQDNLSDDDGIIGSQKRAKGSESSRAPKKESRDASTETFKVNPSDLAANVKGLKEVKQNGSACSEESLPNGNMETKKVSKKETADNDDLKQRPEAHVNFASDSGSKKKLTPDPEYHQYPDPDFNDFDNDRKQECFAVGQIWAVYDNLDGMPRFYARIRKVLSPEFKLRITWLEPDPDDENEIEWVNEDLPTSCGKFRNGNSEDTKDHLMFSHLISWAKGSRRDTYRILPREGETWALFKDWDIKWYSEPDQHSKYEYEFVEILSDYEEGVGVSVAYLVKVKGFASLFCRMAKEETGAFQVPPAELFRFAHRIPSYKMTGAEGRGVPAGSFELDPASLPLNVEEIAMPKDLEVEAGNMHRNGPCLRPSEEMRPTVKSDGHASMCQADVKGPGDSSFGKVVDDHKSSPASAPEAIEIPEPEFYNFDAQKSKGKFQIGQIWALYSDEDGLPKYYGHIKKIDSSRSFKLHLTWLASCSLPNDTIQWHDKDMPICCGHFNISKSETQAYTDTESFSHQMRADPVGRRNEYAIFPRKGEVWALYRNWTAEIKCSDLENCEYDMVEVIEEDGLQIRVLILERVDGFNAVFKARIKEGSRLTIGIPRVELLRFSHQIPAFQLTEERDGSLRGFWELDPAALPVKYFSLN